MTTEASTQFTRVASGTDAAFFEKATQYRISFIYSFTVAFRLPQSFAEMSQKWPGLAFPRIGPGTVKCGVGKASSDDDASLPIEACRRGFDPILNSEVPTQHEIWLATDLGGVSVRDAAEPSTVFRPSAATLLMRLGETGAGTFTITLTFDRSLTGREAFTVLDLVRNDNENRAEVVLSALDEKYKAGHMSFELYPAYKFIIETSILPALSDWITGTSIQGKYQCPYIFTHVQFSPASAGDDLDRIGLPWEHEPDPTNAHAGNFAKTASPALRRIVSLLLRPKIWPSYLATNFNTFRVPNESLAKDDWFKDHDFFWDKRALILYHPRSTVYLSALPWSDADCASGGPAVDKGALLRERALNLITWCSLIDTLELVRARWHFYVSINTQLDRLVSHTDDPLHILREVIPMRTQFTRSLTCVLPHSQTASHLVELARKAESECLLDALYDATARKFESLNWLYTDIAEQQRLEARSRSERDVIKSQSLMSK